MSKANISRNEEQCNENFGTHLEMSGHLFIAQERSMEIPKAYRGSVRGAVTGFSPGAGIRMRRYLRSCVSEYTQMVTLTYPGFFTTDGAESKNHLRRFLQEVRRWDIRNHADKGYSEEFSAFWFLEFQKRGAPHYHIFLNRCPNKDWVAKTWYRIVGSEDIRHYHAGTRTESIRSGRGATISYASKYAAKQEQKEVPEEYQNVGRFWGIYGNRAVVAAATFVTRRDEDDGWVKVHKNSLFAYIKLLVEEDKARVLVRKPGVLVAVIIDSRIRRHLRVQIERIQAQKTVFRDLFFEGAELEYGELYAQGVHKSTKQK